ncbi:MAG TPA: glycosyltransferase family 4 protein [Methylomirabilota bacterium]
MALETLRWARAHGVPAVLESPNGHIRHFREVYAAELARWCGGRYRGHPTDAMVERVEEEYALADRIRVSSEWARRSLIVGGVPGDKIQVIQQPVDLARYAPAEDRRPPAGPLRICFVGSLDLRKGFVYLLKALQQLPVGTVSLRMVGATGDRCSRYLLARESSGLDAVAAPGDPRPVYAASELMVLPTLEDGSPFAVAEAMASGLPVVTTSATGAAEWVREDVTGWVVPPADARALAGRLLEAAARRGDLPQMGCLARRDTARRAGRAAYEDLRDWLLGLEL